MTLLVLVRVVVAVALLVIVPLGLRLIGGAGVARVRRLWWPPAALTAAAMWVPRGELAVLACLPYVVLTLALVAVALRRIARVLERPLLPLPAGWPVDVAVATALATPSIGALALVAERAGYGLFGFKLDVLALTVAHFHVAGFAASLVAGLVARATSHRVGRVAAALCVPAGTLVVLAGFFVGDEVQLAGAAVLTAGLWTAGWLTFRELRPHADDRTTRGLLAVSSVVLAATMALALSWAFGEATGIPHPSLTWMAATHGVGNALGFALCAVLAWRRLAVDPL